MIRRKSGQSVAWFLVVGCTAAGLHFGVAMSLVRWAGLAPLLANVGGWLAAVGVSSWGHLHLSFRHQNAPAGRATLRFVLVSAAGFAVNELVYALLLGYSGMGYQLALAVTLVVVAFATFVLSRHWAFRGT